MHCLRRDIIGFDAKAKLGEAVDIVASGHPVGPYIIYRYDQALLAMNEAKTCHTW